MSSYDGYLVACNLDELLDSDVDEDVLFSCNTFKTAYLLRHVIMKWDSRGWPMPQTNRDILRAYLLREGSRASKLSGYGAGCHVAAEKYLLNKGILTVI